ncbi:MAG: C4-type zinc ribbon domain-containing protein [Coriobacteriales bacterium]|jgi:predicted  nucleic acid-binding Zn-ribbon protein|nr:C4-type zinc ribbon domain-containing protein [Coriobacteriales bacterium]
MSDAKTLLELTTADYALLRLKKQLDELPQRAKLLELRTKRAEVDAKAAQVAQMRKDCEQTLKRLQDEEATLRDKTAEAQKQIDKTTNYKEVTALTREIESFARRAEKTEFETLKQYERSDKIAQVEKQVGAAQAKLAKQDEELFASYQSQVAALKKEGAQAQQQREKLTKELPDDLRKRYEKAREAKGGIGVAYIEGSHCSACRVELTEGQRAKLKSGGEIGSCPHCHRLLVVKA